MLLHLILGGRPITKKNHTRRVYAKGRVLTVPSAAYEAYENACLWMIKSLYKGPTLTGDLNLCARYWMPDRKSWPDLVGLIQATQDILQKAKVVEDDQQFASLDGSRIAGVDKHNPRVEVEIRRVDSCSGQ